MTFDFLKNNFKNTFKIIESLNDKRNNLKKKIKKINKNNSFLLKSFPSFFTGKNPNLRYNIPGIRGRVVLRGKPKVTNHQWKIIKISKQNKGTFNIKSKYYKKYRNEINKEVIKSLLINKLYKGKKLFNHFSRTNNFYSFPVLSQDMVNRNELAGSLDNVKISNKFIPKKVIYYYPKIINNNVRFSNNNIKIEDKWINYFAKLFKDKVNTNRNKRLSGKYFLDFYHLKTIFNIDDNIRIINIIREQFNNIKQNTIGTKLTLPTFNFTRMNLQSIMPSYFVHWHSSEFSFRKSSRNTIYFLDSIYTKKLLNTFFAIKYLHSTYYWNPKRITELLLVFPRKLFAQKFKTFIKLTALRTSSWHKDYPVLPSDIYKYGWLKKEFNFMTYVRSAISANVDIAVTSNVNRETFWSYFWRPYLSIPRFKHTATNVIIDLFLFNNKKYKFKKFIHLLTRRGLYKYMYSMYVNSSEKIQDTLNRPRFFYLNLIEPNSSSHFNNIINLYHNYIYNKNKTTIFNTLLQIFKSNNPAIVIPNNTTYFDNYKGDIFYCDQFTKKTKEIQQFDTPLKSKQFGFSMKALKVYLDTLEEKYNTIFDESKLTLWSTHNLKIRKKHKPRIRTKEFGLDKFKLTSFKKKHLFSKNKRSINPKLAKEKLMSYFNFSNIQKKNTRPRMKFYINEEGKAIPWKIVKHKLLKKYKSNIRNNEAKIKRKYLFESKSSKNQIKSVTLLNKDLNSTNNKLFNFYGKSQRNQGHNRDYEFNNKNSFNENGISFKPLNDNKNNNISNSKNKFFDKSNKKDNNSRKNYYKKYYNKKNNIEDNSAVDFFNRDIYIGRANNFNNKTRKSNNWNNNKDNDTKDIRNNNKWNNNNNKVNNLDNSKNNNNKGHFEQIHNNKRKHIKGLTKNFKVNNFDVKRGRIDRNDWSNNNNTIETKKKYHSLVLSNFKSQLNKLENKINEKKDVNLKKKVIIHKKYMKYWKKTWISVAADNNKIKYGIVENRNQNIKDILNIRVNKEKLVSSKLKWDKLDDSIFNIINKIFRVSRNEKSGNIYEEGMNNISTSGYWYSMYYLSYLRKEYNKIRRDIIVPREINYHTKLDYINIFSPQILEYYTNEVKGKLNIYLHGDYNKRESIYNDKLFRSPYRYLMHFFVYKQYINILTKSRSWRLIYWLDNLNILPTKIRRILNYSVLYDSILVKTIFDIIKYNYRSLINVKPEFYFIDKIRYYKSEFNNSALYTLLYSLSSLKRKEKVPENFWQTYDEVAGYKFNRIKQYSILNGKFNLLLPFTFYFEDILYSIYGKFGLVRLWPLKKKMLSSSILIQVLSDVSQFDVQGYKTPHIKNYWKSLKRVRKYIDYAGNETKKWYKNKIITCWPNELLNLKEISVFKKFNKYDKKLGLNDQLVIYRNVNKSSESLSYRELYKNLINKILFRLKLRRSRSKINIRDVITIPLRRYINYIKNNTDIVGYRSTVKGRIAKPGKAIRAMFSKYEYGDFSMPTYFDKYFKKQTYSLKRHRALLYSHRSYKKHSHINRNGILTLRLWLYSRLNTDIRDTFYYLSSIRGLYTNIVNKEYNVKNIISKPKSKRIKRV